MLIDDNLFITSQNLSSRYSDIKYGDLSFRDLGTVIRGYEVQPILDFFMNMIIQNKKFNKSIDPDTIRKEFADYAIKYAKTPDHSMVFIREEPPYRKEISKSMIDMINSAEKSIKII